MRYEKILPLITATDSDIVGRVSSLVVMDIFFGVVSDVCVIPTVTSFVGLSVDTASGLVGEDIGIDTRTFAVDSVVGFIHRGNVVRLVVEVVVKLVVLVVKLVEVIVIDVVMSASQLTWS